MRSSILVEEFEFAKCGVRSGWQQFSTPVYEPPSQSEYSAMMLTFIIMYSEYVSDMPTVIPLSLHGQDATKHTYF